MTNTTEEELRKIADYLGCNEGEFVSEVSKLIEAAEKAKVEEVIGFFKQNVERLEKEGVSDVIITVRGTQLNGHQINCGAMTLEGLRNQISYPKTPLAPN